MMKNFFLKKEVRPNVRPKNFKNLSYRSRIQRLAVVLAGQGFRAHGLFFSRAISSSTLREHPPRTPPLSPTRWLRRCKVRVGRSLEPLHVCALSAQADDLPVCAVGDGGDAAPNGPVLVHRVHRAVTSTPGLAPPVRPHTPPGHGVKSMSTRTWIPVGHIGKVLHADRFLLSPHFTQTRTPSSF